MSLPGVQHLSARRYELGKRFFRSVTQSDSWLHDFLPQRRDSEILSRLRRHTIYPIPLTRTTKYRSFRTIHYDLAKSVIQYAKYHLHCILISVLNIKKHQFTTPCKIDQITDPKQHKLFFWGDNVIARSHCTYTHLTCVRPICVKMALICKNGVEVRVRVRDRIRVRVMVRVRVTIRVSVSSLYR